MPHAFRELRPPTNPDLSIWRYMDLARFLSLIQSQALFLCPISEFDDPFEGSVSEATLRAIQNGETVWGMAPLTDASLKGTFHDPETCAKLIHNARMCVYATCWHLCDHESVAMWRQYASEGKGLAIRSTYDRLRRSLGHVHGQGHTLGSVEYIDYASAMMPKGDACEIALLKRREFQHEKELRILVADVPRRRMAIPCALEELMAEVVLAPQAPGWLLEVIKNVLDAYKLTPPVRMSSMHAPPPWGKPAEPPTAVTS